MISIGDKYRVRSLDPQNVTLETGKTMTEGKREGQWVASSTSYFPNFQVAANSLFNRMLSEALEETEDIAGLVKRIEEIRVELLDAVSSATKEKMTA